MSLWYHVWLIFPITHVTTHVVTHVLRPDSCSLTWLMIVYLLVSIDSCFHLLLRYLRILSCYFVDIDSCLLAWLIPLRFDSSPYCFMTVVTSHCRVYCWNMTSCIWHSLTVVTSCLLLLMLMSWWLDSYALLLTSCLVWVVYKRPSERLLCSSYNS